MAQSSNSWNSSRNYYELLGVSYEANMEEIRLAYEEQLGKMNDAESPEFMDEVTQAYETLSDPERRVDYDDELRAQAKWQPEVNEPMDDFSEDVPEDEWDDDDLSADDTETKDEPGKRAWYVVHSYSGYENKVKKNLEHRIESMGMQDLIFQVIVPTEEEVELRDGQRKTTERRVFPGYILVEMIMTDDSWYVVRNTPGVTGFVGSATNRPRFARKKSTRFSNVWKLPLPR